MMTGATLGEDSLAVDERAGQSAKPTFLCSVVFTALGLLMLAAAGLKTYQLHSQPMLTLYMVGTLAVICFELCFGTWLLIGVRSAWILRAAIVCFAAFASVSAYKYLTGATSCGCFGTVQVNPAITLAMDIVSVILLISCRAGVETTSASRLYSALKRSASVAMVLSIVAVSVSLYGQSRFTQRYSSSAGDLVALEPESWPETRWCFLGESGVPSELDSGTWDVVLFRYDCHVCHEVMLGIEQALLTRGAGQRVALISIDASRGDVQVKKLQDLGCVLGHLPEDREWFTTTPLLVRISDGICVSAMVIKHWE